MTIQLIVVLLVLAGLFIWLVKRNDKKRKKKDEGQGGGGGGGGPGDVDTNLN